jgi:hypothetical protein
LQKNGIGIFGWKICHLVTLVVRRGKNIDEKVQETRTLGMAQILVNKSSDMHICLYVGKLLVERHLMRKGAFGLSEKCCSKVAVYKLLP